MTTKITLNNLQSTIIFGKCFADTLKHLHLTCFCFKGTLGAGKTTITRAIVESLPNGDSAEISSPSFTICNIYQTKPPVHHYDLYRLPMGNVPEELEESLENENVLTILEWSEHLPAQLVPAKAVLCEITVNVKEEIRVLSLQSGHAESTEFINRLVKKFNECQK